MMMTMICRAIKHQKNDDEFEDVDIENGEIPNFEDVGSDA